MAKKKYFNVVATDAKFIPGNDKRPDGLYVTVRTVDGPQEGVEEEVFLRLEEKSTEYTMKGLRALGWTGEDITNPVEGLGSIKAVMSVTTNGKYRNISFFPMKEQITEEGLREFAKKYLDAAKAAAVIPATAYNLAGNIPPAKQQESGTNADLPF